MNTLAAPTAQLISDEYRRMQEELHRNPDYGVASVGYAPLVAEVMQQVGATELRREIGRASCRERV